MSKLIVSYSDNQIVFTNSKGASEKLDLNAPMGHAEAIKAIQKEQKAGVSASVATVSLLAEMLNTPALDGYKGQTPVDESPTKEFRDAVRRQEDAFLKPLFMEAYTQPIDTDATKAARQHAQREKDFGLFLSHLRKGGTYSNVKSHVLALFAYCGQLPVAGNGKLLAAIACKKLVDDARSDRTKKADTGIAGKLMELEIQLANRTDKTVIGEVATALASLKNMLAVYETIATDIAQTRTSAATGPDVHQEAKKAIAGARRVPSNVGEALV